MKKYQVAILVALVNGGVHVAFAEEAKSAAAVSVGPIELSPRPAETETRNRDASQPAQRDERRRALNPQFVPIRSSECDQHTSRREAAEAFESFQRRLRGQDAETGLVLLEDAYRETRSGSNTLSMRYLRHGALGSRASVHTAAVLNSFHRKMWGAENSLCSNAPSESPQRSLCRELEPHMTVIRARALCYASVASEPSAEAATSTLDRYMSLAGSGGSQGQKRKPAALSDSEVAKALDPVTPSPAPRTSSGIRGYESSSSMDARDDFVRIPQREMNGPDLDTARGLLRRTAP